MALANHFKLIVAIVPLFSALVGCEMAPNPLKASPSQSEYEESKKATIEAVEKLEQRYAQLGTLTRSTITVAAELDQENRRLLAALQTKETLSSAEEVLKGRLLALTENRGQQNFEELMELKPNGRWFNVRELDPAGHRAAFILLQHGDISKALNLVPEIKDAANDGLLSKQQYALFADRVAVVKGEPQEFGSQAICLNGEPVFPPIRDPDGVNQRRKEVGMTKSLKEYQRELSDRKMCE